MKNKSLERFAQGETRPSKHARAKGGQAMVEFVIGLVPVLALLAGLLQVATLAHQHSETMIEARRRAAELAMTDLSRGANIHSNPDYIRRWRPGPDDRPHTRADIFSHADAYRFQDIIVNRAARPEDRDLMERIPHNRIHQLRSVAEPVNYFGLVRGRDTRSIPLIPAARNLYYRADNVEIEVEAWLTWMKGIY